MDCIFCAIVDKQIPADIVAESERTLAFRDIAPKAPTHVLVIPKVHQPDIASLALAEPEVTAELLAMTRTVADVDDAEDYRVIFNTGAGAGQTVFHAHAHVLAGGNIALGFE